MINIMLLLLSGLALLFVGKFWGERRTAASGGDTGTLNNPEFVTVHKALLELFDEGHFEFDFEKLDFEPDENWLKFSGYRRDQLPKKFPEVIKKLTHPNDRERLSKTLDVATAAQLPNRYIHEFRIRHANGEWIWVRSTVFLLKDDKGQPKRALVKHTNISDLKEIEFKLNNSQALARLRDVRIEGPVMQVAPEKIYGVENPDQEWFQVTLAESVHPDDFSKFQDAIDQSLNDQQPFELELRIFTREHLLNWVVFYGKPVADPSGSSTCLEGVFRIITEQKQAQNRHVEFGKLLEDSLTGLVITRISDLSTLFVNQRFCQESGYTRDEATALTALSFLSGWSKSDMRNFFSELLTKQHHQDKWSFKTGNLVRKDGTTFPINAWQQITQWQGETAVATMYLDISDLLEAQQALRHSDEKYRQLFDALPDGVLLFGKDSIILDCNLEVARSHGWRREELIGQPLKFLSAAPAEIDAINKLKESGSFVIEGIDHHRDGSEIFLEAHAKTITIGDESLMLCILRDISERHQHLQKLEQQKNDIEQFTYAISHDLKSPLITIRGFSEVLESNLDNMDIDSARNDLERINRSAKKMHSLITELLEYSRIGITPHQVEAVPMAEIIEDALDQVAGQIHASHADIKVQPKLPTVNVNPVRIAQLYQNLIDNAIKFRRDDVPVKVELGWHPGKKFFFVDDNGRGIVSKFNNKVFRLFDQLDPGHEGSGVGLATAKRIIDIHHGHIWVESPSPLGGCRFCFTLDIH